MDDVMRATQSAARGVRRLLATLALLLPVVVVGPHRRERAKRLSGPAGPHRGRLCRRRRQRHFRAPRRAETLRLDRPAGGDRESSGSRRPACRRIRLAPAGRRLYAPCRRQRCDVDRAGDLSGSSLPDDHDLRSARHDRELSAVHGDRERPSGQDREGRGRVGQSSTPTRRITPRHRRPSPSPPNC